VKEFDKCSILKNVPVVTSSGTITEKNEETGFDVENGWSGIDFGYESEWQTSDGMVSVANKVVI
jgi:hypothetical protein